MSDPVKYSLLQREPVMVSALVFGLLVAALHGVDVWLLGEPWRVAASTVVQQIIALLGAGFAARSLVVSPASIDRTERWVAAEKEHQRRQITERTKSRALPAEVPAGTS